MIYSSGILFSHLPGLFVVPVTTNIAKVTTNANRLKLGEMGLLNSYMVPYKLILRVPFLLIFSVPKTEYTVERESKFCVY